MSNSRVRKRRYRRERIRLGFDPCNTPNQFRLARHIKDNLIDDIGFDVRPGFYALSNKERAQEIYRFISAAKIRKDITKNIL